MHSDTRHSPNLRLSQIGQMSLSQNPSADRNRKLPHKDCAVQQIQSQVLVLVSTECSHWFLIACLLLSYIFLQTLLFQLSCFFLSSQKSFFTCAVFNVCIHPPGIFFLSIRRGFQSFRESTLKPPISHQPPFACTMILP